LLQAPNAELTREIEAQPLETEREPKVSMPTKFDDNRKGFRWFICQVELVFMLNPKRNCTYSLKMGFVGTLLTGRALDWFTPMLEAIGCYTMVLNDYQN
jgi:hypothetical protein